MQANSIYSEIEFHRELSHLAAIVSNPNHTSDTRYQVASYINQFLKQYQWFLNGDDFQPLERIVTFLNYSEFKIFANNVNKIFELYSANLGAFIKIPAEIVHQFYSDVHDYRNLRRSCKYASQVLPIEDAPFIQKGKVSNICDIARASLLLYELLEKKQDDKARRLLHRILQQACPNTQARFWGCFNTYTSVSISQLITTTLTKVTVLSLPVVMNSTLGSQSKKLQTIVRVIEACSDSLEWLELTGRHAGSLPSCLLAAILKCKKLKILDIANFYLERPLQTLPIICQLLPEVKLRMQMQFSLKLLELPDPYYRSISALNLRFDNDVTMSENAFDEDKSLTSSVYSEPRDITDAKAFVLKCENVQHLHLNCPALVSTVSDTIESLSIIAKRSILDRMVELPVLLHLKSLSFVGKAVIQEVIDILKKAPALISLQLGELCDIPSLHNQNWLSLLSQNNFLEHLQCQARSNLCNAKLFAILCKQLKTLRLELTHLNDSEIFEEYTLPVNEESSVSHLTIRGVAPLGEKHPLEYLAPFIAAANPEEILFRSIRSLAGDAFEDLEVVVDEAGLHVKYNGELFSFARFTRLKRVIICLATCWTGVVYNRSSPQRVYNIFYQETNSKRKCYTVIEL